MQFKVYILYSPSFNKLFTGMTSSLTDRMKSHNGDDPEDWTNSFKPWTLVHMELFEDEYDAVSRESYYESEEGEAHVREDILPLFAF